MWRKPLTIQAVRICWRAGCPIKTKPTSGSFPLVNRELPELFRFLSRYISHTIDM
jgi:hypothetical protein